MVISSSAAASSSSPASFSVEDMISGSRKRRRSSSSSAAAWRTTMTKNKNEDEHHEHEQAHNTSTKKKKRKRKAVVYFHPIVHTVTYDKITDLETKHAVWYQAAELSAMKDATKTLAISYRTRVERGEHQAVAEDSTVYRGVEAATSLRQTAKLLANGVTLYAQHHGGPAREVANLYAVTAQWSTQLARLQALHDYVTVYPPSHFTSPNRQNKNHSNSKSTAFVVLPPVSSLCPPKSIVPLHLQYRIAATHQHKQQQHHSTPQSTRTQSIFIRTNQRTSHDNCVITT